MSPRLFPPPEPGARAGAAEPVSGLNKAFGDQFGSVAAQRSYLQLIVFPRSRAWRYQLNGKSGTTFMMNLLFELEFGQPFTTRVSVAESGNQHPHFALFQMVNAGLLSNALREKDAFDAVRAFPGLTLATVRNPYDRARSGFAYLCRSHDQADRRFLPERLRLNALTGFDWTRHPGTTEGFDRFLSYLEMVAAEFGAEALDPHWRPQALHIRPEILQPDLIGRTEALDQFAQQIAQRLNRPLPEQTGRLRTNRGENATGLALTPDQRARIATLYAADFDLFEYAIET